MADEERAALIAWASLSDKILQLIAECPQTANIILKRIDALMRWFV